MSLKPLAAAFVGTVSAMALGRPDDPLTIGGAICCLWVGISFWMVLALIERGASQ